MFRAHGFHNTNSEEESIETVMTNMPDCLTKAGIVLPEGWTVTYKIRQSGATKGVKDFYYYRPGLEIGGKGKLLSVNDIKKALALG